LDDEAVGLSPWLAFHALPRGRRARATARRLHRRGLRPSRRDPGGGLMIDLTLTRAAVARSRGAASPPRRRDGYRPVVHYTPRGVQPFSGCRSRQHRTISECYYAGEVKPPKVVG